MKTLFMLPLVLFAATANADMFNKSLNDRANFYKNKSCQTAYGIIAAMVASQAPEEVIKYTVSEMLGDDLNSVEKQNIYLNVMYIIHSLRGLQLVGEFGDVDQNEWAKQGYTTICDGERSFWPYD